MGRWRHSVDGSGDPVSLDDLPAVAPEREALRALWARAKIAELERDAWQGDDAATYVTPRTQKIYAEVELNT